MRALRLPNLTATLALAAIASCGLTSSRIQVPPEVQHAPREPSFDVEHYFLEIEVVPEDESLRGTCTVRLHPLDDPLEVVELDLRRLSVGAVRDGRGRELEFEHAGGELRVRLAEPVPPGDYAELAIDYGGRPAKGLMFSGHEDGLATQVFTHGECEDSSWWFPCWDFPSDRATSEIRVTLPAGWVSVAAGERIDSAELADGRRVDHWRMNDPHPAYLVTLVAGDLAVVEDDWDGVPLYYVLEPELEPFAGECFGETPRALEVLSEITGRRYPYAKYSQACVDDFPYGGMENVSATTMTDVMVRDELGYEDYDPVGLLVHEAAHQWFGDLLTCADWSHIWLNEGFATYFTSVYVERTRGVDDFRVEMRDAQEEYMRGDVGEHRRPTVYDVYREPMDLFFGGHTYPGGASRLHMLRFELGDEAFFRGLRTYVADNSNRSVVTADFRRAMERESGRDLEGFFDQWFHRAGYPELEVGWDWDASARVVRLDVVQVQDPARGTPSVFRFPVDVEVRTADGAELHRVEISERRQRIELPADSAPEWVRFDKHGWIVKRLRSRKTVAEWTAIAERDDDVNGRRDAVAALALEVAREHVAARHGPLVESLLDRLRDEHRAVRRLAAEALGHLAPKLEGTVRDDARRGLVESAAGDPDAGVQVMALQSLAAWGRDPELADFGRERFRAGVSWDAMAAAAGLVAAADPAAAEPWIYERLEIDSLHGALESKLLPILAALDPPYAAQLLRERALDEDEESWVREAAVGALAPHAKSRSQIREELVSLLGARPYRLRSRVIEVLGQLDDARVVPALEDYYATCTDTRQKRAIEGILRKHRFDF